MGAVFSSALRSDEFDASQFKSWWLDFRDTEGIPEKLKEMEDYFVSSGLLEESSKFWLFLNRRNIEQITYQGYENFKQTVACNYFTWLVNRDHGYAKNLFRNGTQFLDTIAPAELTKKHALFTEMQSLQYNQTTVMFYFYLIQNGAGPYLEKLEEPQFGNPPSITISGKSISQDTLNSLLEYLSIATHCSMSTVSCILEVGAGSGRTAWCFLKQCPNVKYIIVDYPPALYLSQTYLTSVFPDKKAFLFRPIENAESVQEELDAAELIFLTPDQMRLVPDKSVDLFMAIDCLHEMKKNEVEFYFHEANRLSSLFYYKCWMDTVVPLDEIPYPFSSYPVRFSWRKIFEGECIIPSDFSHAFYQVL